jgi:hypothetical protein
MTGDPHLYTGHVWHQNLYPHYSKGAEQGCPGDLSDPGQGCVPCSLSIHGCASVVLDSTRHNISLHVGFLSVRGGIRLCTSVHSVRNLTLFYSRPCLKRTTRVSSEDDFSRCSRYTHEYNASSSLLQAFSRSFTDLSWSEGVCCFTNWSTHTTSLRSIWR